MAATARFLGRRMNKETRHLAFDAPSDIDGATRQMEPWNRSPRRTTKGPLPQISEVPRLGPPRLGSAAGTLAATASSVAH
jgi:hypothetical protein